MTLAQLIPDDPIVRAAGAVALAALVLLVIAHRAFPVPK